jgi:ABC-2 type transport system permease protein
MMRRLWPVARREYLERVRSKAFLIGTLVGPALLVALVLLPHLLAARQRGKALTLAVVDDSGHLKAAVEQALARKEAQGEARFVLRDPDAQEAKDLKAAVLKGGLDGYLHIPADALEASTAEYYGRNVSNMMDLGMMEDAVREAFVAQRLEQSGIDTAKVKDATRSVDVKRIRLSAAGAREDRGGSFLFSVLLLMMLYTTVLMWGQAVMTGVIEEKSNRVVEVVASSIPATTFLAGKLVGVGAVGLTQFLVWTGSLAAISFSGAAAAGMGGIALPEISGLVLVSFVVFFLLGYFLYSALYASIGAAVNTIQEAQSLIFPVLMPLIAGMVCFPIVLQSPDSTLATVLSLIPLLTPLVMFLRITVLTPPAWQIALSMVLMLLAIALVNWAAARIYRVGILMYGKRPTFPEILRWVGKA